MSRLGITSMTVSVDYADKDFGKGSSHFCNLTSKTPEDQPIPFERINEVIDQGLDMYFTTFKTLLAGRFATGSLSGAEFKDVWTKTEIRFEKVKKFLKENENE